MVVGEAMVIAGIGCRKGVGAEDVLAAIAQALDHFSAPRPLDGLATGEIKLDEGGIAEASAALGVPLRIISIAELKSADDRAVSSIGKITRIDRRRLDVGGGGPCRGRTRCGAARPAPCGRAGYLRHSS